MVLILASSRLKLCPITKSFSLKASSRSFNDYSCSTLYRLWIDQLDQSWPILVEPISVDPIIIRWTYICWTCQLDLLYPLKRIKIRIIEKCYDDNCCAPGYRETERPPLISITCRATASRRPAAPTSTTRFRRRTERWRRAPRCTTTSTRSSRSSTPRGNFPSDRRRGSVS